MRREGALNARLQDIASRLGIAYTALYHYFRSRDQLTAEVLLLTLRSRGDALEEAAGESAMERLLAFVARNLGPDREHHVPLPPLFGLSAGNRKRVLAMRNRLVQGVAALIDEGVSEGSVRACHPTTVANLLLDLLDAFVVFDDPMAQRARSTDPQYVAEQLSAVLHDGVLADRHRVLKPSYDLPDGDLLLGTRRGVDGDYDRLDALLQAATIAFNREGAGASIPRIAAGLGISKTVFYQYFTDKQDLLCHCYLRGIGVVETSGRIAHVTAQHALDEVLIHRRNLYRYHGSPAGPFTLLNAIDFLRPEQQRIIRARNHGIRHASEERILRAVQEGALRADFDVAIVQRMFGRALYGVPGWHSEHYPLEAIEVQQEFAEVLFRGMAALQSA
jgi:AcrR family transcriptional regulator